MQPMNSILAISFSAAILLVMSASDASPAEATVGHIERLDPALDALVAPDAKIEVLAEGLDWTEGPVWRKSGGYLLFSDIPKNTIYRWDEKQGLTVFLRPAGYTESDPPSPGSELGCNGLTLDAEGHLVMADQGDRRIALLQETNYVKTTLADQYQGRRLNSPNDLVYRSNGDLYFTDPPYGLTGGNASPQKELQFNGVYRLTPSGQLILLTRDLTFPNGIAFSPDEKTLYVAVSDHARPVVMAYDVEAGGGIVNGHVFFDAGTLVLGGKQGLPDGMKVDQKGNVFLGGPGGVLVIDPRGKHLGTIVTGQVTANCAFGGDGSTLYMTADHSLLRVQLKTKGARF